MVVAPLLLLAQAGSSVGPSAADVQALVVPVDGGCIWGFDRRTRREVDFCLVLAPHVARVDCREAADLGGYVCDYSVRYADDSRGFGLENDEVRSDLFARNTEMPDRWRLVREITPSRMPTRQ